VPTGLPRCVICNAPAKVNLALHVVGKRSDGYHDLDTLVVFANIGDRVVIAENPERSAVSFAVCGPFSRQLGERSGNLAFRAASTLKFEAGSRAERPVHLTLEKNLPVAGGIGGGSADAAAALLGLVKFWNLDSSIELEKIANRIGADVAMCLASRALRATGTGTQLQTVANVAALPAILVNPGIAVSTAEVFAALGSKRNTPIGVTSAPFEIAFLAALRNDLEVPAIALAPEIAEVLHMAESQPGCLLARMSGSGATCVGLFGTIGEARIACREIRRERPDWWCVATELGSVENRVEIIEGRVNAD
jgi:4-diphosphocytidyl-2-C-methyl-D-erythritol kinase